MCVINLFALVIVLIAALIYLVFLRKNEKPVYVEYPIRGYDRYDEAMFQRSAKRRVYRFRIR